MTAAIRTRQDAIEFSGQDFTFHRTTRQALNLYDLRDQVQSFSASISAMEVKMGSMENDTTGVDNAANLQAFEANTSARFSAMANSIATVQAAASAAAQACVPYVEYDAGNNVCRRLNYTCDRYEAAHYEYAPPTRTSDRVCRPKRVCTAAEFMSRAGSDIEDAACSAVTNCTARGLYASVQATATSDAVCIRIPGLVPDTALRSCQAIKLAAPSAPSGLYWIRFGSSVHRTFCHMSHEGGGWTLVGRGRGSSRSCWQTSSDCNLNNLAVTNWNTGGTCRLSDNKINSLSYDRILFMGTGSATRNGGFNYWLGKDAGGCSYRHMETASSHCNCASNNVDMSSRHCGSNYWTHKGAGDWPSRGSLHTSHHSEWWMVRNHQASGSPSCSGVSNGNCHAVLFVR
jgi:hypothetical protein